MKATQYIQNFILIFITILFTSCGVTSQEEAIDFDYVDNSEMTPDRNYFGYYGYDVIFGEEYIVGDWVLYDTDSYDAIYAHFYQDGILVTDTGERYLYGVSWDGLSLDISTGERIEIVTSHIYRYEEGYPCYRVEISEGYDYNTADMCPLY